MMMNSALNESSALEVVITVSNKKRVVFDFSSGDELRKSCAKLEQIVCSSHWSSGIDISGLIDKRHGLLLELVKLGVIIIDECEYELQEPLSNGENARHFEFMLGKRNSHRVLREMAALFADEPFERAKYYRNTIYFPNLKAFARADGMKPEDIAEMLARGECERIILFPYFPLDEKSAYYELTLGIEKERFINFMKRAEKQRQNELCEAIRQANERANRL